MTTAPTPQYIAGLNPTGYMPEEEPQVFDTLTEAWAYIAEEIAWARDLGTAGSAEWDDAILAASNSTDVGSIEIGGYEYWTDIYECEENSK